jgi:hypothetical protein
MLVACSAAHAGTPAGLIVTMPPPEAQRQILDAIRQIAPQREEHRRYRLALPFGAPLFPPDDDFAALPLAPKLGAWLALPATARQNDVLIVPDVDYYWNAEGRQYSCQFLIHIAADGAGSRLALLQVRPIEYAGKHIELLGRTGPGLYITLRPATPSVHAEAELAAFLAAALARQQ